MVLPSLCRNPNSTSERAWRSLDVKRVLSFCLDHTKDIRKSEALFVLFGGPSEGKRASVSSLSWWRRTATFEAYKAVGRDPPEGVTAHSTSAVFEVILSFESICRAAAWSSTNTLMRHYKIDQAASF